MVNVVKLHVDKLIKPLMQQSEEILSILREGQAATKNAITKEQLGAMLLQLGALGASMLGGGPVPQAAFSSAPGQPQPMPTPFSEASFAAPASAPSPSPSPAPAPAAAPAQASAAASGPPLLPSPSAPTTSGVSSSAVQERLEAELKARLKDMPNRCVETLKAMRRIEEVWLG